MSTTTELLKAKAEVAALRRDLEVSEQQLSAACADDEKMRERLQYARSTTEGRRTGWEAESDNRFIEGFLLASRYAIEDFNYILTGEFRFGG